MHVLWIIALFPLLPAAGPALAGGAVAVIKLFNAIAS